MRLTRGGSMLHLQMGQEMIYLLLMTSLFVTVCLAGYVLQLQGREEQPPILTLQEASGYSFPAGSSTISPSFEDKLRLEIVPELRVDGEKYNAFIIEVIGHTDEVPLHRQASTLDTMLLRSLNNRAAVSAQAGDNVGLGMTRAVAVARRLRALGLGRPFVIIPLSAGPVVRPGDVVSDGSTKGDDRDRRRIELRLRRPPPITK